MYYVINEPYLMHYGIKGQKWGIRKYQNPDGTLTDAGKARYLRQETKRLRKEFNESRGHKISRKDERGARLKYIEKHYKGDFHGDVDAANRHANAVKRRIVRNAIFNTAAVTAVGLSALALANEKKTEETVDKIYDMKVNEQQIRYMNNKAVANLSRTGSDAQIEATKEMLRAYSNINAITDDAKSLSAKKFIKKYSD